MMLFFFNRMDTRFGFKICVLLFQKFAAVFGWGAWYWSILARKASEFSSRGFSARLLPRPPGTPLLRRPHMRQQTKATPRSKRKPPTPTTTPITMFRFLVERPPPPLWELFWLVLSEPVSVGEVDSALNDAEEEVFVAKVVVMLVGSSAVVVKVLVISTKEVETSPVTVTVVFSEGVVSLGVVVGSWEVVVTVEMKSSVDVVESVEVGEASEVEEFSVVEGEVVVDCWVEEVTIDKNSDVVSNVVDGSNEEDVGDCEEDGDVELVRVVLLVSCLIASATNEGVAAVIKLGSSRSRDKPWRFWIWIVEVMGEAASAATSDAERSESANDRKFGFMSYKVVWYFVCWRASERRKEKKKKLTVEVKY